MGTVSNVLNHPDRVAPATLAEVTKTIEDLGYVPNDVARQLRAGQSSTIGMIVPDITNPFFTGVLRGVEDSAADIDLSLIVGDSGDSEARQASYLDLFEKQRVRGVLISPIGGTPARLKKIQDRGTPVVLVDVDGTEVGLSGVSVDDVAGGFMATRHLIDGGARQIAFLAGNFGYQQVTDRLEGAQLAIRETPGCTLEVIRASGQSALAGREAAEGLLKRSSDQVPEAIFAANDMLALGVLQAVNAAGSLRIPGDMLLIGYDDIEFAQASIVPLSSVRQPADVMGRTALSLMQERFDNPQALPRQVTFEPELIVRSSTTSPR